MTCATAVAEPLAPRANAGRTLLLVCGVLSSLVYVAANVAGALSWEGYSSMSQTVSENPLIIVFGWGVWASAGPERRALRIAGASLVAVGVIGLAEPSFPCTCAVSSRRSRTRRTSS